jgi:cytochrome c-type biogenesis protein CcmH/NrfF
LVVSLPVIIKVFKGKDIFVTNINLVYWYIPVMAVFLILFSIWGYGKYKNVTDSASHILEELEDTSS